MKFKNIISYLAVAVVMCFVVSAAVYSGTITKGKWTKSDMALWTGTSSTEYERKTSTGYNLILPYFDYMGVDVLEVYGGNVNANTATLQLALDAIETTNERLIWMAPTTWDIDDDISIPINITMQIPPGAMFTPANGKELRYIEGGRQIQAGNYQIFDESAGGTVTIASAIMEHDMWRDGSGLDWFPSSDAAIEVGSETYKIKQVYTHKISGQPFPGYVSRARFEWKDADEIIIYPGVYCHDGTTEQLLYSDASFVYQFQELGTSKWSYLYFNDIAIVSAATNEITASEMSDAVTGPDADPYTYSPSKHGHYEGDNLCVFAVLTDGSDDIKEFYHDGGDKVLYGAEIDDITTQDVNAAWVDAEAALTIPSFATRAQVVVDPTNGDTSFWYYWRMNGSQGSGNTLVHTNNAGADHAEISICDVITDDSQLIEFFGAVSSNTLSMSTQGWYFPNGM